MSFPNSNPNRPEMPLPARIRNAWPTATVPTGPRVTAHTVKAPDVVIVEDTREQRPLTNEFETLRAIGELPAFTVVRDSLHTGDYSVRGLESSICFERKSLDDLVNTLNPATGNYEPNWSKPWKRFNREIMRMQEFRVKAILCESSRIDVIRHNYRSQISPQSIIGMLQAIELDWGVQCYFLGSRMAMAERIVRKATAYHYLRFKKFFRPEDGELQ